MRLSLTGGSRGNREEKTEGQKAKDAGQWAGATALAETGREEAGRGGEREGAGGGERGEKGPI